MASAANSGMARLASIEASIAARAATMRQQSNIDFLNDINLGLLKDSALFNLNIAINSSDRLNHLLQLPSTPQKLSGGARVKRSAGLWMWEAIMKTFGAAFATALLLATTGAASAADFPVQPYYAAPPPMAPSWAGPYIGAMLGYEWGSVSNNPTNPSGVVGGADVGFNWQRGNFVYGVEGDINLSGADDTFAPWQFSNPWFGTVRGRAGVAVGNVLIYGTAGLAFGELTADTAGNLSEHHTSFGWAAGGGAEVGFTPHWSAKAEWLFLDFSSHNFSVTGQDNGLTANLLRLGVNYHF